ncbi:MAG: shikimate kinase [Myxococcales bacterium]|nr:shikimate kinase [Myxococcales bacterium]MCB9522988.1 shikimate kinase [Myxococcales bacterium]
MGPLLAERLGRPFIDLDTHIERIAGLTVAQIFQAEGEAGFRRREADALKRVLGGEPAVIALGGGAVVDPVSRALIRAEAVLITLTAEPATLRARLADCGGRPLAAGDPLARLAGRAEAYADCDLTVPTDGQRPEQIAAAIAEAVA